MDLKLLFTLLTVGIFRETFQQPVPDNPLPDVIVKSDNLTVTSNGDYIIKTGQNFTIECHGSYPPILNIIRRNKISTAPYFVTLKIKKVVAKKSSIRDFLAIYHVTEPDFQYTGFYECFYEDNKNLKTSVYIYVQDPEELFAPTWSPFLFLAVYHYRKRYLPCRVTDPSIEVKLVRNRDGDVQLGNAVSYDPRYGFILHYPDQFFEGQFECVATSPEGKTSTIMMILRYLRQESTPQPALISSKTKVFVGETYEMQCRVQVNRGSSIFLKWGYSSNEMELPVDAGRSDRVSYTDPIRIPVQDEGYDTIVSNLTVLNAVRKDEGVYMCSVTTYDGKTNNVSMVIHIVGRDFLTLTPWQSKVDVIEGTPIQFGAGVTGDPTPAVSWWFGSTQMVSIPDVQEVTIITKKTAIHILKATRQMAGIYTVKAQNSVILEKNIELVVKYKPEIEIKTNKKGSYYVLNQNYEISCELDSVPQVEYGDTWWEFVPCGLNSCVNISNRQWTKIGEFNFSDAAIFDYYDKGANSMILQITALHPGIFRCNAKNKVGNSSLYEVFRISEMEGGLNIDMSNAMPIEEDRVTLICYASLWEFHVVSMYYKPQGSIMQFPVQNSNRTILTFSRTKYSLTIKFEILSVQLSYSGIYVCRGDKSSNVSEPKTTDKRLSVKAIVKPKWRDGSHKQDAKPIISKDKYYKVADCDMVGVPDPTFRWYKDNVLIDEDNNKLGIYFTDDDRSLHINLTSKVHTGIYTCEASNRGGVTYSNWSITVGALRKATRRAETEIIVPVVVIATFIIIIIVIVMCILYRRKTAALHKELEKILIHPSGDYLPYDPKWEFPKKKLRQGMVLGEGAFGRVIKAEAIGIQDHEDVSVVAVKMVKDCTDKEQIVALLSELKILIHLGQHLNIVSLLGAVTKNIRYGELMVIVEYCHFGNLRNYLIKNKESFKDTMEDYVDPMEEKKREARREAASQNPYYVNKAPLESTEEVGPPLTTKNLICWLFQVARGMEYLASKKYFHRDLAARHVLLTHDNFVKICDFDSAKDLNTNSEYHKNGDGPVPVKWMAIECLTHRVYTTKSDVWSYGVFIWELFSLGGTPYPGIEINQKFINLLKDGYVMEKPEHATEEMYKVMKATWTLEPEDRPSFTELACLMGDFLETNVKQMSDTEESQGACGYDGNRKMNGATSDYNKMEQAPPPPTDVVDLITEKEQESARYIIQKQWRTEKADDVELQPLTGDDDNDQIVLRDRNKREKSPQQVNTFANIHRKDDRSAHEIHENWIPTNNK